MEFTRREVSHADTTHQTSDVTCEKEPVLVCRHQDSIGIRNYTSNCKFLPTRRDLWYYFDLAKHTCEACPPVVEQQQLNDRPYSNPRY
jgi:hypothetical protein